MKPNDHRVLGRELKLFCFDDEVGRGLPLWLPRGAAIRAEIEKLMEELEFKAGYQRVASPHLARESLFVRSGHLPYYAENMYPPMKVDEGEVYRLRPMNCPHHHRIFASAFRSYRDLPLRLAEYGQVYRYEDSGALNGLHRARGCSINDAHIYCRKDQLKDEFRSVLDLHLKAYELLNIRGARFRLSLWDPSDPEKSAKYVNAPEAWAEAEGILRELLVEMGAEYVEAPGEAAFYGPKIDLQLINAAGREESFSSIQLDFSSAERMDLFYVDSDGQKQRPYIIHRAPLGSHERIIAFLLELNDGLLPAWLAPVQARILPIGEACAEASGELVGRLRSRMIRADLDARGESLERRVRQALSEKIPSIAVIGPRELADKSVMLRSRDGKRKAASWPEFEDELAARIASRRWE